MWIASKCRAESNYEPRNREHRYCTLPGCQWEEVADATEPAPINSGGPRDAALTRRFLGGIVNPGSSSSTPQSLRGTTVRTNDEAIGRTPQGSNNTNNSTSSANNTNSVNNTNNASTTTVSPQLKLAALERALRLKLAEVYQLRPDFEVTLERDLEQAKSLYLTNQAEGQPKLKAFADKVIELKEKLEKIAKQERISEKNGVVKGAIASTNGALLNMNEQRKAETAQRTADQVSQMNAQTLAALSPAKCLVYMSLLKCHAPNDKLPPQQRAALNTLFGAMQLDKDFCEHDEAQRAALLDELVEDEELKKLRDTWEQQPPLAENNAKKDAMRRIHQMQCAKLGLPYKASNVVFQSMSSNSGVCVGGVIKIATNPDATASFDNVLNTVIHETSHAYQEQLVKDLDDGKLSEDDPRYIQAWAFKLNDYPAYANSVPNQTNQTADEKRDDLAYHKQPLEQHAMAAGDEAAQAFAIHFDLGGLDLDALAAQVKAQLPAERAAEVDAIMRRMRDAKGLRQGASCLAALDELAAEVFTQALATAEAFMRASVSKVNHSVIDETQNKLSKLALNKTKLKPRDRLRLLAEAVSALQAAIDDRGSGEQDFEATNQAVLQLLKELVKYDIASFKTLELRRYQAENFRGKTDERLRRIKELHEELLTLVQTCRQDQQSYDTLLSQITANWTKSETFGVNPIIQLKPGEMHISEMLRRLRATAVAKRLAGAQEKKGQ